jgi:hypothetical protein
MNGPIYLWAKGRVERKHGPDRDRPVKELRLEVISKIGEANRFFG